MRKAYRVKSEQDFQRVFNTGNSVANRRFVVYQLEKPGQKHFRVGLSVGKKVGNAVTRNQVKRKLRAGLQELAPMIRPDLDFIVIARPSVNGLESPELHQNLRHVLKLANIINQQEKGK